MNYLLRDLCPPLFARWYHAWRSGQLWSGDFQSWDAAAARCEGYEDADILARVTEAVAVCPGSIIIDRTGHMRNRPERIMTQRVPPSIYKASYPYRFFVQSDVKSYLAESYNLKTEFSSVGRATPFAQLRGLHFRRKANT
ncbi:hypothetical protein N8622_00480 [bacterium]|nr:hypothetical protein [bacterium]